MRIRLRIPEKINGGIGLTLTGNHILLARATGPGQNRLGKIYIFPLFNAYRVGDILFPFPCGYVFWLHPLKNRRAFFGALPRFLHQSLRCKSLFPPG